MSESSWFYYDERVDTSVQQSNKA